MPELPEVETVMRGLARVLKGRHFKSVLCRRKNLRFALPRNLCSQLEGTRVTGLKRRAKYILIGLSSGQTLLLHLGMSGRVLVDDGKEPLLKHDHVIFTTDKGKRLRFNDARRFGVIDLIDSAQLKRHKLLANLGLEPLAKNFTGAALLDAMKGRKCALKQALMDQNLVVGVGNIYASEALFHAGISPKRKAGRLKKPEGDRLVAAIKKVLKKAIAKGGSTLRDYRQSDGELGYFQHEFSVYGRDEKPCKSCAGLIRLITQGARSTYYCAACQK